MCCIWQCITSWKTNMKCLRKVLGHQVLPEQLLSTDSTCLWNTVQGTPPIRIEMWWPHRTTLCLFTPSLPFSWWTPHTHSPTREHGEVWLIWTCNRLFLLTPSGHFLHWHSPEEEAFLFFISYRSNAQASQSSNTLSTALISPIYWGPYHRSL